MKRYEHLKQKAVQLRRRGVSLTDICERLSMSKTTVWYWIKDIDAEIPRTARQTRGQRKGSQANKHKCALARQQWYEDAMTSTKDGVTGELRDFVVMYMGEGYRRNRNTVQICNSNPIIMVMSHRIMRRNSNGKFNYTLNHHIDHDAKKLRMFWGRQLGVSPNKIEARLKSGSSKLSTRQWRCPYGVLSIRTFDTKFRMRLQAWIDYITKEWGGEAAGFKIPGRLATASR